MNLLAHRTIEYYLFILFSLFSLHYAFQALLIGDTFRLLFVLIPAFILSLVPFLVEYTMKVDLIPGTKSLIALALLLHVAGGINRFYWLYSPFYDKLAHVISALALLLVVFSLFEFLDYYEYHYSRKFVLGAVVFITAVFMVAWECAEYSIDLLVQSSYNNGLYDTIGDLIANLVGIGIGLLVIRYHILKIPPGKGIGWLLTRIDS
jgi:hypothetical protein